MTIPTAPCLTWTPNHNQQSLTTIHTPAPTCSDPFVYDELQQPARYGPRILFNEQNPLFYECLPQEYQPCKEIRFSPGWCPQGWVGHNTVVNGPRTTATCCMGGFTPSHENLYVHCMSTTRDATVPTVPADTTFRTGSPSFVTLYGEVTADHGGWAVTWHETGLLLFGAAEKKTEEAIGTSNTGPTSTVYDTNKNSTTCLETGVVHGVVAGVVGALIAIGGLCFVWGRRRGQKTAHTRTGGDRPELSWRIGTGFSAETGLSIAEPKPSSKPIEVPANRDPAEVLGDSHLNRAELFTSGGGMSQRRNSKSTELAHPPMSRRRQPPIRQFAGTSN